MFCLLSKFFGDFIEVSRVPPCFSIMNASFLVELIIWVLGNDWDRLQVLLLILTKCKQTN